MKLIARIIRRVGRLINFSRKTRLLAVVALLLFGGYFSGGWEDFWGFSPASEPTAPSVKTSDLGKKILRKVESRLKDLDSYYALWEMTLFKEPGELRYRLEQWSHPHHGFRLEMKALQAPESGDAIAEGAPDDDAQGVKQVFIGEGEEIEYLYHSDVDGFYPLSELASRELPSLFLEDFWESLLQARQVEFKKQEAREQNDLINHYVLEAYPAAPHLDRVSEVYWLEPEHLLPSRIKSFDQHGFLTREIKLEEAQLEVQIEEDLFTPAE